MRFLSGNILLKGLIVAALVKLCLVEALTPGHGHHVSNANANATALKPSFTLSSSCPLLGAAPACPPSMVACSTTPGYCYSPSTNTMYSTYFLSAYDFCPADQSGKRDASPPITVDGVTVWIRQGGYDPMCQATLGVDCPGNDITSFSTHSASDCTSQCLSTAGCVAAVTDAPAVNTCWLKTACNNPTANTQRNIYKAPPGPYLYLACYRDTPNRALPMFLGQSNTIDQCYQLARAKNLVYFGLQNSNQCFGSVGEGYDKYGPAGCNMKCAGSSAQICGDSWANSVYQIQGVNPFLANQPFPDKQLFCTAMKKQYCIIPQRTWGFAAKFPLAQATWATNDCNNNQSDHDEYCAALCDISNPNTPGCWASDNTWCVYDSNYYGCLNDHAGTYGNDGNYCRPDGNYQGCVGDHGIGPRALDRTWCREDGNRDGCLNEHRVGGTFADDGTYCRQDQNYQGCLNDHSGTFTLDGTFCRRDQNYDGCMADHNHYSNPCKNAPAQIIVKNQMSGNSSAWITTYTDGGVIKMDWGMAIKDSVRRFCAGVYASGSWYKVTAEVRGEAKTSTRFYVETYRDGSPEQYWTHMLILRGGNGVNPYFDVESGPMNW